MDSVSLGRYKKEKNKHMPILRRLYEREFTCVNPHDINRAKDGVECRWHYASLTGQKNDFDILELCLSGPCSILEMMVALADKCYCLMGADYSNDRSYWFWLMMENLGFDKQGMGHYMEYIDLILDRFLAKEYSPDGHGSLFVVHDPTKDTRDMEIWYQMCACLNEIS